MKPTHVLWDFNGTVLDDVAPCIRSINELLEKYGCKPLESKDEYQSVFGFPIRDYYSRIGFDFDRIPYETLAVEWVELYNRYNDPLTLCPHVREALDAVKAAGIPQLILTASSVDMVRDQLSGLGIGPYFEKIIGVDNIHAYGKIEIAQEWIRKEMPKHAVLIGDTTHDREVADAIGADCALVSCGHMSADKLKRYGNVYSDPLEAVKNILE